MAYIALKPVRFDKDYAIGEIIPDGVVNPAIADRIMAWGKMALAFTDKPPANDEEITDKGNKTPKKG